MKAFRWMILWVVVALVLGACTPTLPTPSTNGPDQPVNSGDSTPLPVNTGSPSVETAALEALAKQLGVKLEEIKVTGLEPVEWPNTCLGAEKPGEACAEMMVSGFRVTLEVNGKVYEVHTNMDASNLRIVEKMLQTDPQTGQLPTDQLIPAVTAAIETLANQLGITPDLIKVASFEPVEWSDGCLGLGGPAESCMMAMVPGYRVNLEVNGQKFEVRTDQDGSQVRVNPLAHAGPDSTAATPNAEEVVLVFQRSGGIAGLCDNLEITAGGLVTVTTCKNEPVQFQLTALQQALLKSWLTQYASFEYHQTDPATADAMTINLIFAGFGSRTPSMAEQEEIINFAAAVFGQK